VHQTYTTVLPTQPLLHNVAQQYLSIIHEDNAQLENSCTQ